jgi:hypothetical protein
VGRDGSNFTAEELFTWAAIPILCTPRYMSSFVTTFQKQSSDELSSYDSRSEGCTTNTWDGERVAGVSYELKWKNSRPT